MKSNLILTVLEAVRFKFSFDTYEECIKAMQNLPPPQFPIDQRNDVKEDLPKEDWEAINRWRVWFINDLENHYKYGAIRRGCFCPSRCRGCWWMRPSLWPCMRRRTLTSSRGTWCSLLVPLATASSKSWSRRPTVDHPTSLPCPSRSSTSAVNSVFTSTGRWESLARTRRVGRLPSCATSNSSAHRWLALPACTGTSARGVPDPGRLPTPDRPRHRIRREPETLPEKYKECDLGPRQRKSLAEFVFGGRWGATSDIVK
jgi:hypothetical protein